MQFQCPLGLELLPPHVHLPSCCSTMFQCPLGLELLRYSLQPWLHVRLGFNALSGLSCYSRLPFFFDFLRLFQCPLGLELLRQGKYRICGWQRFNALSGLSCYFWEFSTVVIKFLFQCPLGLELLLLAIRSLLVGAIVSMPSRA